MKKNIYVLLIITLVLLVCSSCNLESTKKNEVDEKFIVNSVQWGASLEYVKDDLKDYKVIKEDANRTIIGIDNYEYLETNGELMMEFSSSEENFPEVGFIQAYFVYDAEEEKRLIENGEKVYGARKEYFLDKDGIENPLNPSAWCSNETIEKSLSEEEKKEYINSFNEKQYDDTRIDAILRGPLVIISVDEEKHMVRFQGNSAAIVNNIKRKTSK